MALEHLRICSFAWNGIHTHEIAKLKQNPGLHNSYDTTVDGQKALFTLNAAENNCLSDPELSKIDIVNLLIMVAEEKDCRERNLLALQLIDNM